MKTSGKVWARLRNSGFSLLGLAVAALGLAAWAQSQDRGGVLTNFQWPDYYDPPHERQLRWLLKSAEARVDAADRYLVQRMTLEKFQETGAREMLMESPECRFDDVRREASSPGPLKMELQGGRFTLEGEGFLWQHTNMLLVVSNRVRTDIHGGWMASPGAAPALGDARVLADQFIYAQQTTQALYRGHVRVTGTNLALGCGQLSFALPSTSGGAVDKLVADQDVTIAFNDLHASGDHAVYAPASGSMQLTGQAAWQAQGREGRSDALWLDSAAMSLRARGGAMLKLPVTGAGFIPQPTNAAAPSVESTNRFITITSERYELQTNRVSFGGGVEAVERADDVVRSRLACDSLFATFGPSNQVQDLVAERGVVIEQGDRRLTGARATFDAASGAAELTGEPQWRDGGRSGAGRVLRANLRENRLAVLGDASLNLPRDEADRLFGALTGGPTNRPAQLARTNAAATPARVTSDEYTVAPEEVAFRGRVRLDDAQMQLTTDALTLKLAPGGTNVVSVAVEQNVVMSLVGTNGQATRVTCAQAVYTATNSLLQLTGAPAMQHIADGVTNTCTAPVIWYDPATGNLSAPQGLRGRIVEPPRTNAPASLFDTGLPRRKK
jgi:lipopolysaccharide export system protein LptA